MPELPEVETVKRGIRPHIEGQTIVDVIVREARLRRPVPPNLPDLLRGQRILDVARRAKYLCLDMPHGALIIHLGMSGSLQFVPLGTPPKKHDHIDLIFEETCLRYHDPRRFGLMLWQPGPALVHPLLSALGPEPLSADWCARDLQQALHNRRIPIKAAIMEQKVVVGVGNIYANEALFKAGIHPQRPANSLNIADCTRLVEEIRQVLSRAIEAGGSSLRDFVDAKGKAGYFQQSYFVYGRDGENCRVCSAPLQSCRIGQRSSYYCPLCQS